MMHNFTACVRKRGDFLKSFWGKGTRKQVAFFHDRTVKGAKSNIFTCKLHARQFFSKTLGLIRLSRFLSHTNHESANCMTIHLTVTTWCWPILSGWLQWGTKVLTHFHKMAPFCIVDILIPFPCLPQPLPPKINVEFWTLKSFFYFRQHWFVGWGDLWRL